MPFIEPEVGGGPYPKDLIGHLLLVWPVGYIEHSPTQFTKPGQPSDVIVVDCVDLDERAFDGSMGVLHTSCWWRQSRLIGSLKRRIGSPDPGLGHMTRSTGGQGGQPPFVLASATADPACVARAEAWIAAHPEYAPTPYGDPVQRPREPEPAPAQAQGGGEEQNRIRSQLERMAAQSQAGADRLPKPPPEDIPF